MLFALNLTMTRLIIISRIRLLRSKLLLKRFLNMTTQSSFLNEAVTDSEFQSILAGLNRFFSKYGVTVKFMTHFKDRINDLRNKNPITRETMIQMFNKLLDRSNLKKLNSMKIGQEGVMVYKSTNFVYTLDKPSSAKGFQLRFITAMDKDRFRSNSPSDFYLKLESFSDFFRRNYK